MKTSFSTFEIDWQLIDMNIVINNAFIQNFPAFNMAIGSKSIVFSANPILNYNGKELYLFADEDNLTLSTNVGYPVFFIPMNVLDGLSSLSKIGMSRIQVANWTSHPNLHNSVILCKFANSIEKEVGILSPYLIEQDINAKEFLLMNNAYVPNYQNLKINVNNKVVTFSSNPWFTYNNKQFQLFVDEDNLTIDTSAYVSGALVSISTSLLNSLPADSKIGVSRLVMQNWTANPISTHNFLILFVIVNGDIDNTAGIFAPIVTENRVLKNINNAFIQNFPAFNMIIESNTIIFSANPILSYNGKELYLFADEDNLTLTTNGVSWPICYIQTSVLEDLPVLSKIGMSRIQVANWTSHPNLHSTVVLCKFGVSGKPVNAVGVLSPYFIELTSNTQISKLNNDISTLDEKINNVSYTYPLEYNKSIEAIRGFLTKYLQKNQDVNIVVNGDSIAEHPQDYGITLDYKRNPPLLGRYNFSSLLFKLLRWDGQEYRRADDDEYIFTEVGNWNTANSASTALDDWDDTNPTVGTGYRGGFTRYSNINEASSVQFTVPQNSWAFHFIYRTDTHGGNMLVSVSGGNGKLQVYNGSTWVEANGYIFNTLQTADYANGVGNTAYQVRLKFRSFDKNGTLDTRSSDKNVTVSKQDSATRLCYWGVEWSMSEFMFNVINSSRGSQNLNEMIQTIKTELYDREPSLFLFHVPMLNMSVVATANGITPEQQVNAVRSFLDSVKADANNWQSYQCLMTLPNVSIYLDAWISGTNNWRQVYNTNAKKVISTKDFFDAMDAAFYGSDEIGFINTFNAFMWEILQQFDTYYEGLVSSTPWGLGNTFTDDGTHPNHKGMDVLFKYIRPVFTN